jgi:hypothetical protein
MSRSYNTPQRKKRKYKCKCDYCLANKTHCNDVRKFTAEEKIKEHNEYQN